MPRSEKEWIVATSDDSIAKSKEIAAAFGTCRCEQNKCLLKVATGAGYADTQGMSQKGWLSHEWHQKVKMPCRISCDIRRPPPGHRSFVRDRPARGFPGTHYCVIRRTNWTKLSHPCLGLLEARLRPVGGRFEFFTTTVARSARGPVPTRKEMKTAPQQRARRREVSEMTRAQSPPQWPDTIVRPLGWPGASRCASHLGQV